MATTAQELETTETTKAALPPGPPRLPYIGNLLSLRRDPLGYLQKLQRIYGNMATIYFMKNPAVLLFRPEHVRYVLVEHPRDFSNIGSFQENRGGDDNFGNEGLLTINGEKHRQQRHAVQPAFHKKRVEGYAAIMQQYTQELLKTWQVGDKVDMSRAMQALTLRIVSKCLFSIDLSMQLEPLGDAFDGVIGSSTSMAEDLLNIRIDNPVTGYGKRRAAIRQLNMLIYTLIAQRRDDERDYHDVLSMLMTAQSGEEPGTKLTEKQIHDHILTFLAAGHETTAIALVWTFYLLAQYPEARLKLQDELHSVLGGREPTLEDLAHLPYLDWVLNESMRLYPPAWMQMRFVAKETELDGVRLPVGTMLILSQWVIHRLPDIWEDAETFKPERWDPANGQQIPPGAYFPFGGGPRTCIGMPLAQMEARIILASVLQKFTPQPVSGYTPGFQPVITLRPKRHLEVTLMPASSGEANAQWKQLVRRNELAVQNGVERKGCRTALLGLLGL
ncbi:MAG TPA: cytochrome P450 [Ktedonobacteraceae bacterium]|nr:cytochrome P450 [Ktedonobacteraceae bacterium]